MEIGAGRTFLYFRLSSSGARSANRGSSGFREAPLWIPTRPCGPSGMTSNEGYTGRGDIADGAGRRPRRRQEHTEPR